MDPDIAICRIDGTTCESADPYVPMFIPSSRDCSAYYICFNNRLQSFICGPGQEFNSVTNRCVPAADSGCDVSLY